MNIQCDMCVSSTFGYFDLFLHIAYYEDRYIDIHTYIYVYMF